MENINITGISKPLKYPSTRLLQAILTSRRSILSNQSSKSPSKHLLIQSKCDISIVSLSKNLDCKPGPEFRKRYSSLVSIPVVSATSWCVMDCNSYHWITGHNDAEVREIASLTKIVTCLVCLKYLESNDCVSFESKAKVSFKAARMIGTSACLRIGDYLSLNSLLYALMLPSGNDAAWALAEYFGTKICPNSVKPVKHFVLEMNKLMKELHLSSSHFSNPHGLMQKNNLSTARDVAKITCFAMKNKRFRDIVDTKVFTAEVVGQDGLTRFVTWENTNKLLGNSFCGVKTGITDAAGPCLSVCSRGPSPIVIVLLNSRSMEDRWVEARKLLDCVNGRSY